MKRSAWSSKLGFVFAAAGSAVGLANIWRFPYEVGNNGGAIFVITYLLCLLAIGFPVFVSEVLIGRTTQSSPAGAFGKLAKSRGWGFLGGITIFTGFIVSAFYSAISGWILGYLVEAVKGNVSSFSSLQEVVAHHTSLMDSAWWGVGFHTLFLIFCWYVLVSGVKGGIERGNKIIMPILYLLLILLVVNGLFLPNSMEGLRFLFSPDWHEVTPVMFLIALGQSFFTLSVGQGTMVTYGSYLKRDDNIVTSCFPVVAMDTLVSLLSAVAVFTIVFSVGMEPKGGSGLIFQTLPMVFSKIPGGYFVGFLFFFLVFLAALTSQISAMEPSIAYLIDRFGWRRSRAVALVTLGVFLLGIPSALSSSVLKDATLWGLNPQELMLFSVSSILIPLGGFFAIALVGWKWGITGALKELHRGASRKLKDSKLFNAYVWICFKYVAPVLIIIVFLNALKLF
jgi:neurotransmitter:Na+ symporter, NSS family